MKNTGCGTLIEWMIVSRVNSLAFEKWSYDVNSIFQNIIPCNHVRSYVISLVDWTQHKYTIVQKWKDLIVMRNNKRKNVNIFSAM